MPDVLPQPVGRPQGGAKSPAGQAAYWRMNYESAIGVLADLIAEHTETVEECDDLRAERDRLRAEVAELSARLNGGGIR